MGSSTEHIALLTSSLASAQEKKSHFTTMKVFVLLFVVLGLTQVLAQPAQTDNELEARNFELLEEFAQFLDQEEFTATKMRDNGYCSEGCAKVVNFVFQNQEKIRDMLLAKVCKVI